MFFSFSNPQRCTAHMGGGDGEADADAGWLAGCVCVCCWCSSCAIMHFAVVVLLLLLVDVICCYRIVSHICFTISFCFLPCSFSVFVICRFNNFPLLFLFFKPQRRDGISNVFFLFVCVFFLLLYIFIYSSCWWW